MDTVHESRAFLTRVLSGDSILAVIPVSTSIYVFLMSIVTLAAVGAMFLLSRARQLIADSTLDLIFRIGVALGIANVFVYPMFTQDMWMSVVWGRMLLDGHNPYYEFFTARALAGTPLVDFPIRMTYGPLWAWVAAVTAALGGANGVWAYFASKLVVLACWVGTLWLVRAILADTSPFRRAGALCFFGWWPISVYFAVGEGHNDVALVAFVLLWIYLTQRSWQWLSIVALAASVLVKFVSAPLVIVEMLRGSRANRRSPWPYMGAMALSAFAGVLVTAPLWRDMAFFDPVLGMQGWEFLSPAQAASSLLRRLGIPLTYALATLLARGAGAAVSLYYGVRYVRTPDRDSLVQLVLAVMSAVLFAGVSHVWPWFLIWVLAPAALAGTGFLWRLAVAAALAGPFLDVLWLASGGWSALPLAGVAFFGVVGALTLCPAGWRRLEWGAPS